MKHRIHIPEADLRRMYCDERLSTIKIGKMYGCHDATIRNMLRGCGIQMQRQGPYSGHLNPYWNGGVKMCKGYVLQFAPNHPSVLSSKRKYPYVPQHRLVMENHLGRYLTDTEVVHHINECRSDNRIENLQLMANQTDHNRLHLCGKPTPLTADGRRRKAEAGARTRRWFLPVDDVRRMYVDELLSSCEIASHFGCSADVVRRALRDAGVQLRGIGKIVGKAKSRQLGLLPEKPKPQTRRQLDAP